jgi:hypothetical protein
MEQFRAIRVVLPAFVLMGSMLLGAWLAGLISLADLKRYDVSAIGGIAAAAVIPVGFAIGALSVALLALWHAFTGRDRDRFELSLPRDAWERLAASADLDAKYLEDKHDRIWVASIWIRLCVSETVRELADRRYHASMAHLNAVVAVFLSYMIGILLFKIPCDTWQWYLWSGVPTAVFAFMAGYNRFEGSRYIEIASTRFRRPVA